MSVICPLYSGTVTKVRAKLKQYTGLKRPLIEYITSDEPTKKKQILLNNQVAGIVSKIHVKINDKLEKGKILFEMVDCPHDIEVMAMCAACGIDMVVHREELKKLKDKERLDRNFKQNSELKETDPDSSNNEKSSECESPPSKRAKRSALVSNMPELRVNREVAKDIARQEQEKNHRNRKLILICDLDHTLIHSSKTSYLNEDMIRLTKTDSSIKCFDLFHPKQSANSALNAQNPHIEFKTQTIKSNHTTKLRPHLSKFLERISEKYVLYISTLGARKYADEIADAIDPEGKFFSKTRLLSRDDLGRMSGTQFHKHTSLKHLFPAGESQLIMIDDRSDVWSNRKNCIHVPKYNFWKSVGDINDPNRKNLDKNAKKMKNSAGGGHDGKDKDDYLLVLEGLLSHVHSSYYIAYDKLKKEEKSAEKEEVENEVSGGFKVPKLPKSARESPKPVREPPTTFGAMHWIKSHILKGCTIAFENQLIPETEKENKRRRLYGPVQEIANNYRNWHGDGWSEPDFLERVRKRSIKNPEEFIARSTIHMLGGKTWISESQRVSEFGDDTPDPDKFSTSISEITHVLSPMLSENEWPMTRFCKKVDRSEKSDILTAEDDILDKKGLATTVFVVAERWLWNSYWLWRRIDEKMFNMEAARREGVAEALKKVKTEEDELKGLLENSLNEEDKAHLSQNALWDMEGEIDEFLSSDDETGEKDENNDKNDENKIEDEREDKNEDIEDETKNDSESKINGGNELKRKRVENEEENDENIDENIHEDVAKLIPENMVKSCLGVPMKSCYDDPEDMENFLDNPDENHEIENDLELLSDSSSNSSSGGSDLDDFAAQIDDL